MPPPPESDHPGLAAVGRLERLAAALAVGEAPPRDDAAWLALGLPWWAPPPGMLEAVKEYMAARERWYLAEEPDWSGWVPPYEPGKPWPWRKADGAAG
jgi:hypothetical protein